MIRERSAGDVVFNVANTVFLAITSIVTIYPLYYVFIYSLNNAQDSVLGGLYLYVRSFTFQNYTALFRSSEVVNAYAITAARTVIGMIANTFLSALFAYGMQKKRLIGRKLYHAIAIIPMFFSGGLIPTYLLIRGLGLTNSFLVYVVPTLVGIWYMIVTKAYLNTIPASIEESARMDGANELVIFVRIIVPMAVPILACVALWNAIAHWNAWFDAYIYTSRDSLQTIQLLIRKMIRREAGTAFNQPMMVEMLKLRQVTPRSMQAAATVVTIAPILVVYPFIQRYFIKGIVLGAVKE